MMYELVENATLFDKARGVYQGNDAQNPRVHCGTVPRHRRAIWCSRPSCTSAYACIASQGFYCTPRWAAKVWSLSCGGAW